MKIIFILIIIFQAAVSFAQNDTSKDTRRVPKTALTDRNFYIIGYSGSGVGDCDHNLPTKEDSCDTSSSSLAGNGIGFGYSKNTYWSLELQYQYVLLLKTTAPVGSSSYELRGHTIKNNDNKIQLEVSYLLAMVKRNYNLYNSRFFGRLFWTLGLGEGYKFSYLTINDGGKLYKRLYITNAFVLMPISLSYQYKNWVFGGNVIFYDYRTTTGQFNLGYYFM